VVERAMRRRLVADTDIGKELKSTINELECLLEAYRAGTIIEKT